jgi:hypothetical protein
MWSQPVIRPGDFSQEPFRAVSNTAALHRTEDQLVGAGRGVRRGCLSTFRVRFSHADEPRDDGWHSGPDPLHPSTPTERATRHAMT